MKLTSLLKEIQLEKGKWETIPHNEIEHYEKKLLDLINIAYTKVGGNPNFRSPQDIRNPKNDYEVIDIDADNDIDAASISKKTPAGTKLVATAHDGSREAIHTIIRHKIELLNHVGYFSEVSGKLKDILLANHVQPVTDEEIVRKVLVGKDIEWLGDGTYSREIGGHKFVKMMVGKPRV
jgi:hypothetical protein